MESPIGYWLGQQGEGGDTNDERARDRHREVLQVLLKKMEADPYPSVTMMDMAEQMLNAEDVTTYARL